MEDVLDLYDMTHDPDVPSICFDEKPYQMLADRYPPLRLEVGKPKREDYTYARKGVCNLFVMFCPQLGWRHVEVTGHRKAVDFAECVRDLIDIHFADAKKVRIVCDNLNTHNGASFYKRFTAEEARRICRKVEFHYTPKHASWLNMAEIEIHALGKQCIDRRIGDVDTLRHEIAVWETERNQRQAKVNWHFTTEKARSKFQKHYDKLTN